MNTRTNNNTTTNCRHIQSTRNPVPALHPHLPKRSVQMTYVRLTDLLQTEFLYQQRNVVEAREHIGGQLFQFPSTMLFRVSTVHVIEEALV